MTVSSEEPPRVEALCCVLPLESTPVVLMVRMIGANVILQDHAEYSLGWTKHPGLASCGNPRGSENAPVGSDENPKGVGIGVAPKREPLGPVTCGCLSVSVVPHFERWSKLTVILPACCAPSCRHHHRCCASLQRKSQLPPQEQQQRQVAAPAPQLQLPSELSQITSFCANSL